MKTVRDGQKVWPYCDICGCRLDIRRTSGFHEVVGHFIVRHFGYGWQDARGHSCSKINHEHIVTPQEVAHVGA